MALGFYRPHPDPRLPDKRGEAILGEFRFIVHKLNNRPRPRKRDRVKIVSCFSEFGCEVVGVLYCLPRLLRRYPGQYVIAMGWHGREYLYRHLVDEFWEAGPEFSWLREHTRAFHHNSANLKRLEEAATEYGAVVPAAALGTYAVGNTCRTCGKFWHEWRLATEVCPACGSTVLSRSIFGDVAAHKKQVCRVPGPGGEALAWAARQLPPRSVGVFARGRRAYGRNLPPEFYVKLLDRLAGSGYHPVWMGEPGATPACPVEGVWDFSRTPEARDLERTLALVSHMNFTVQFWTASTRLAGLMGVPFLLFESPEQVYASQSGLMAAQEGKRLELCTFGPKKIVLAHYTRVAADHAAALALVGRAVGEMEAGNWDDVVGLVQDPEFLVTIQQEHREWLR